MITTTDLAQLVSRSLQCPKYISAQVLIAVAEALVEALAKSRKVRVPHLGTFTLAYAPGKRYRHPTTRKLTNSRGHASIRFEPFPRVLERLASAIKDVGRRS